MNNKSFICKENVISLLKEWQLDIPEIIDAQMAVDHMTAFVQALEYESYSKENCQRVAELSVGKFLCNREAFLTADTNNNIAAILAERCADSFIGLLEQLDILLPRQLEEDFYGNDRPFLELSYDIKFYKKDGEYITNLQDVLQKYINENILRSHNYAALIRKTDIKVIYSEEVLPPSSNVIIKWLRKILGRQSKWSYWIDDDKLLRDHTICKAVCHDFYVTGYIQTLADELRRLLISKIENYFEERGE
ncbi:hypothetical protein [Phascolarctobacterium faecium]|jgi:hypothetical protein|uniref:hypothetical protein n=1 Tax=Phascolarctobacterium faecium TaxID=33025 RepID=UPI00242FD545|nr:hypothetical protein [Phascolarctobacterium faecium]